MTGRRPLGARALGGLVLLNFVVWGWSIGNDFVFDDLANIASNTWIKDWQLLTRAFVSHVAGFDPSLQTSFYRPAMHVLYAMIYAAAGPQAWAFHLLNVLLHTLCVLCVYLLTRAVVDRWGPRWNDSIPLVAAVVFSVHPVHVEAVAWIAGVTDLSYSLFGLLALIAYVRSLRRPRFAIVSGMLLAVSLLCKETGAMIVPLMLLAELYAARAARGLAGRATVVRLTSVLVPALAYLVIRLLALGSFAPSAGLHAVGATELFTTAAGLFTRYLWLLVAPVQFGVARSIPLGGDLFDPITLAGFLAAATVVVLVVRFRGFPLVVLSIAAIALPLIPVLYVPAIMGGVSILGERYLYLPVLGVGWLVGLGFERLRRRRGWGGRATIALVIALALPASAVVISRNRAWADSLSLWTAAVAQSPNLAAAHEGLCFALYDAGRIGEALEACDDALALDPARIDARINRATALLALGSAAEAKKELDGVLSARPDSEIALINRGLACMVLGQPAEAISSYRRALEINPLSAEAHNVLGVALARLGRGDEARFHLEQASSLAPDRPEYRANLEALR